MKVLVVEDDVICQKLALLVLTNEGYEVVAANTVLEAESAVERYRPDVILLDLQMPGTNGLEFVRCIRRKESTALIPVVAMTAYPLRWTKEEALAAGCQAYVVKPLDTRGIGSLIDSVYESATTQRCRT